MYDHATQRRRTPVALLTWVLAGALAAIAVTGIVWVLTSDLGAGDPGAVGSASPEASASGSPSASPEATPVNNSPSPSPTPSEPPEPPEPTAVTFQSAPSGRCLDVPGGNAADGAALQLYDCNGSSAQEWTASASGELRVLESMCLDDPSGGEPGQPATIWTCHGAANQQWSPQADGTVRNAATGLCLDVANALTDNGTPVVMYTCHAGENQRWSMS